MKADSGIKKAARLWRSFFVRSKDGTERMNDWGMEDFAANQMFFLYVAGGNDGIRHLGHSSNSK